MDAHERGGRIRTEGESFGAAFLGSREFTVRGPVFRLGFYSINFWSKPFARSKAASVSRRHERLQLQRLGEASNFIRLVDSQNF